MRNLVSETRLMWGMPITVAIVATSAANGAAPTIVEPTASTARGLISRVFDYFAYIDDHFSTYKPESEISRINRGGLTVNEASHDMRVVFALAEEVRVQTNGYFNIAYDGKIDPSGLVKGWALSNAATMLRTTGCEDFFVDAGGDFQAAGANVQGRPWRVGIRNPFNPTEIVKVLGVSDRGVATSGTYIRGQHIYNPVARGLPDPAILSITVVGPDVYEADCYATSAFAMGRKGIEFIESLAGFEGYMIDGDKIATFTSGFERYVDHENH